MAEPFDFAGAARELVGCLIDCDDAICRDARTRGEAKLREAFARGLIEAAALAQVRSDEDAVARDRARAAGRELVGHCRQSDVETLDRLRDELLAMAKR